VKPSFCSISSHVHTCRPAGNKPSLPKSGIVYYTVLRIITFSFITPLSGQYCAESVFQSEDHSLSSDHNFGRWSTRFHASCRCSLGSAHPTGLPFVGEAPNTPYFPVLLAGVVGRANGTKIYLTHSVQRCFGRCQ
jgi:hypothetical protein